MINSRVLPPGADVRTLDRPIKCSTVGGIHTITKTVRIRDLVFPEFDRSKTVYGKSVLIFDNDSCPHDVIVGRDFLEDLGLVLSFEDGNMKWMDRFVPMKLPRHWDNSLNWFLVY